MTPHWTFIFNEMTKTSSCSIGARRNFFLFKQCLILTQRHF